MSEFRVDQITNQAGTRGPEIAGITTFSSTSGLLMPSGPTEYRGGRGRGLFAGGYVVPVRQNIIDYVTISTAGNALDFGDLTSGKWGLGACSSSTRGVFGGGFTSPTNTNILDFVTISSTGNAFDFGDLTTPRSLTTSCSSSTRGIWAGGQHPTFSPSQVNIIDYITISTLGDAADFGDLTLNRRRLSSCSSPTRGVFFGGRLDPAKNNILDYITIASTGNAIDFGDLIDNADTICGCSNSVRGVFAGGLIPGAATNTIQFITIASTGDAQDFGDLSAIKSGGISASSPTRGLFAGGYNFPTSPITIFSAIEFVTIASTGNATTFGNLFTGRYIGGGCSDAHGGLGD